MPSNSKKYLITFCRNDFYRINNHKTTPSYSQVPKKSIYLEKMCHYLKGLKMMNMSLFLWFYEVKNSVSSKIVVISRVSLFNLSIYRGCTVLYLKVSVLLEALPNSVNPKDPISVKTL